MPVPLAVGLVIGAAFVLWNSVPKLVAAVMGLILLVLLINRWPAIESYWKGGNAQ